MDRIACRSATANSMRPQDDHRWRLYPDTILEFLPGDNAVAIDLRVSLSDAARAALRDCGLPDSFVVLTACNPRGLTVDDDANRARMRQLREQLHHRNLMWIPTDGVSPDGRHLEPGVAVVLAPDDATRLAREFDQSAYFACDGAAFKLNGAVVDAPPIELPPRPVD